jgi:hypothetical protein
MNWSILLLIIYDKKPAENLPKKWWWYVDLVAICTKYQRVINKLNHWFFSISFDLYADFRWIIRAICKEVMAYVNFWNEK